MMMIIFIRTNSAAATTIDQFFFLKHKHIHNFELNGYGIVFYSFFAFIDIYNHYTSISSLYDKFFCFPKKMNESFIYANSTKKKSIFDQINYMMNRLKKFYSAFNVYWNHYGIIGNKIDNDGFQ